MLCRVHPAYLPASVGSKADRRPDGNSNRLGKCWILWWGYISFAYECFLIVNAFTSSLLLCVCRPPPGHLANVLQEANVPIISDAVCNAPDYYDSQITTSMFCAGYEKGGIDACQVRVCLCDRSGVFKCVCLCPVCHIGPAVCVYFDLCDSLFSSLMLVCVKNIWLMSCISFLP